MISVYFDPLDKNYKSVTGAAEEGERIIFRIAVSGAGNCALFVCKDGEEPTEYKAERQDDLFRFSVNLKSGLYFYFFTVDGVFVGRGKRGAAEINSTERYQLTVYKKTESPSRFYGGIMYQIFPDRFFRAEGYGNADGKRLKEKWGDTPDYLPDSFGKIRNDDFFGGNFEGIREKAEYLARLGVTAIYLNPVFKARSNHRYDTGDYFKFDPLLGTEEDFKRLIHTMHTRGIAVVLDGVFNHTGDDSVYFNKYGNYPSVGAYQSQKSEFYPWYDFSEYPEKYASWWGIETLPSVKKDCAAFQRFIAGDGGVLDKYFSLGIDGIRLDVADELSDGFLDIINERVKKYGVEKIIIGEVWEDATNKIAYGKRRRYFQGGELDSVMNYPLKDAIISFVLNGDADALAETVKEQIDHYPRFALANLMNVLGTHDTARILTVLGKNGKTETERSEKAAAEMSEDERKIGVKRLFVAALLQFTLYGFPCIYYGDEIGTEGNKDPFNRKCFAWGKERGEVFSFYGFLCDFRRKTDVFKDGETTDIRGEDGVFSFSRTNGRESVKVVANCGYGKKTITTDRALKEISRGIKTDKITLNTYDFCIFYDGEKI